MLICRKPCYRILQISQFVVYKVHTTSNQHVYDFSSFNLLVYDNDKNKNVVFVF